MSLITLAIAFLSASVVAQPIPHDVITIAYTKELSYEPGQTGKLYIAVLNYKTTPVEINNITIYYSWFTFDENQGWIGNDTIIPKDTEKTLSSNGGKFSIEREFQVPDNGVLITEHGGMPSASIYVYDSEGKLIDYIEAPINVILPTNPTYFKEAEQLVTLFTIQVVLIIVCTIIIAATIFLSARRPRITWKAEEKVEQA